MPSVPNNTDNMQNQEFLYEFSVQTSTHYKLLKNENLQKDFEVQWTVFEQKVDNIRREMMKSNNFNDNISYITKADFARG